MESDRPRVALLDDGELDDIRGLLRELAVAHCDARRATVGERVQILLSTPARARALANGQAEAPPHHLHTVIGGTLDDGAEVPCDLQLRRPIDGSVLRLLTRREGPGTGRRLTTRVALGAPAKVRVGDDRREVIVSQISIGGCGLISPARLRTGARIEIELPPELSAPRRLLLCGEVLSARERSTGDGQTFDVSVAFQPLDLIDRVTLRALMARHSIDFRPPSEGSSGRVERGLRQRTLPSGDRRSATRRRFRQRVMGVCDGVGYVLMARDVSRSGLCAELNERLTIGDAVKLVLFGLSDTPPLLVPAEVDRCDDSDGCFLRFGELGDGDDVRLDALLDALAPIDLDAPNG